MSHFVTNPMELKLLLKKCEIGEIQLPNFQRGWVWDESRIQSLIWSIANAYPVGALMALETGGDEIHLEPKCIEGVKSAKCKAKTLILDGQQRITSLYQVAKLKHAVRTVSTNRRKISRWFYIDMELALTEFQDFIESEEILPEDTVVTIPEEAVVSIPEDKIEISRNTHSSRLNLSTQEDEIKNLMFPVNSVLNWDSWQDTYNDYWKEQGDTRNQMLFRNFKNHVLENFKSYQIPIITLDSSTTKVAVCNVFEKVNTAGKPLDAFELLTAMYAAEVVGEGRNKNKGHNLRDDWFGKEDKLGIHSRMVDVNGGKHPNGRVLNNVSCIDFLKVISLFHTRDNRDKAIAKGKRGKEIPAVSCNRNAILNLPLSAYLEYAKDVEEGFIRAAKFLYEIKIFRTYDLPYQPQIVPLAAIFTDLKNDWDDEGYRTKIRMWYWNGVLGELYGSSVDTRIANDFIEVPIWLKDLNSKIPKTISDANFRESRLDTLRTRTSAAYKGINALLMKNGARDFRSGRRIDQTIFFNENVDIHHIFPRKWCMNQKIKSDEYNTIINKTPLSSRTNQILGGASPSNYLEKLEKKRTGDKSLLEIVNSHQINVDYLHADDFEGFINSRRRRLCKIIEKAMGKEVQYDKTESTKEEFEKEIEDEEYR